MTTIEIKQQVLSTKTEVVEAFVAGEFVATAPELKHLQTKHESSMALAFKAAASK